MNIHEYQAKEILKKYHIPIPKFGVAENLSQVKKILEEMHLSQAVIKIQVHAGGRGKGGGVKFGKTKEEILSYAKQLLGMKLVNNQTGPAGVIAHQVLISEPVSIQKEYYLGAIIDREKARAVLIASPEGGMEIEEVAEKFPEKILTLPILLSGGMRSYHLMRLANFMGWKGEMAKQGMKLAKGVAQAFMDTDASLLEINPLVETTEGKLFAVDAKLSIDENALFRQKDIEVLYDETQVSKNEAEAHKYHLAYISLQGNIGCMVNGAGLAMATMDIIHHFGGKPANFLDVGGSATKEKVAEGFKIILSDPHVKGILVNIFGGIMNCETLAIGIVGAAKELNIHVPLVIRMEGTHVEKGIQILKESGVNIVISHSLAEAAQEIVRLSHHTGA